MKKIQIILALLSLSLAGFGQVTGEAWNYINYSTKVFNDGSSINRPLPEYDYYFSVDGSDDDDGKTRETAKQSIDGTGGFNDLNILPGESVAFRQGDYWDATMEISNSGTSGNPITITSYSETGEQGEKPIIYGSRAITGWTNYSGNIWQATATGEVQQLFYDGIKLQNARHNNTRWDFVTSVSEDDSIFTSTDLASGVADDYYKDSKIIIWTHNWITETHTVLASIGNTLSLADTTEQIINIDEGFILMNKLEYLDAEGEWYCDTATNIVYVWMPNDANPSSYEMRGSIYDYGIVTGNNDYITVMDIAFKQQRRISINLGGILNEYLTFDNVYIGHPGYIGVFSGPPAGGDRANEFNFTNSIIEGAVSSAIYAYHHQNSSINNNTITNTGLYEDIGILGLIGGSAIQFRGKTNEVLYNRIDSGAYNGVYFQSANSQCSYNYITNMGLSKTDGGGIYTDGSTADSSLISYNIIDGVVGNNWSVGYIRALGEGIYIDEDSAQAVRVVHNVVTNVSDNGIFLHDPNEVKVRYNTVFGARATFGSGDDEGLVLDSIENNLFIKKNGLDDSNYYGPALSRDVGLQSPFYDYNYYVNPLTNTEPFLYGSAAIGFTDWQDSIGSDNNSIYYNAVLVDGHEQRLIYNPTTEPMVLLQNNASSVIDSSGNAVVFPYTLQPYTSLYVRGKCPNLISTEVDDTPAYEMIGFNEELNLATANTSQRAIPRTMTETGTIYAISVLLSGTNITTEKITLGIYSDNEGDPDALLAVSDTTTINNLRGWQDIQMKVPVELTSGTDFWIAWHLKNGDTALGYRTTGATIGRASTEATEVGLSDPFGPATYSNVDYSIRAKYLKQ